MFNCKSSFLPVIHSHLDFVAHLLVFKLFNVALLVFTIHFIYHDLLVFSVFLLQVLQLLMELSALVFNLSFDQLYVVLGFR